MRLVRFLKTVMTGMLRYTSWWGWGDVSAETEEKGGPSLPPHEPWAQRARVLRRKKIGTAAWTGRARTHTVLEPVYSMSPKKTVTGAHCTAFFISNGSSLITCTWARRRVGRVTQSTRE